MRNHRWFSLSLVLSLFFVTIGSHPAAAQSPLNVIVTPQGGKIAYGAMEGATSQAQAMSQFLRNVHNTCGEKPQVGRVFKVRGTDSVAVFFTATNHPQGNRPRAGLLIVTAPGPSGVEVGAVMDDAARFGSTVNPMLTQLFSEWHPGSGGQASGSGTGGRPAPPEPLHRVQTQDGSASVAIPNGWKVQGNGGTAMVLEPNYNVIIDLNLVRGATANPYYRPYGGMTTGMGVKMVYPSNVDPVRAFPGLIKEFYRVNNQRIDYRISTAEPMAGPPGQRCVHAIGHGMLFSATQPPPNIQEKDYFEMEALLCETAPDRMGNYTITLSISEIDPRFADRERATVAAILSSYNVNQAVVAREANAIAAPAIAAIHQIGANATARMEAVERSNDAQHAGWRQGEDNISRNGQAFSNYLLDQTVIQDNNVYGNGTIGHGTVWNSTADALVKANPNRYEIVDTPNFWRGWDY